MPLNDIHIRFATESDISTILNFISELAEFEKLAHEVIATEDSLRKHLFGNIPRAELILICKKKYRCSQKKQDLILSVYIMSNIRKNRIVCGLFSN